jgi:uncharacterized protein YjiS (DUF1127 family)
LLSRAGLAGAAGWDKTQMAATQFTYSGHSKTAAHPVRSLSAMFTSFVTALAERHRRSVERAELRAMDAHERADLGTSRVFEEMIKRDSQP